jgi:hypothetical protein
MDAFLSDQPGYGFFAARSAWQEGSTMKLSTNRPPKIATVAIYGATPLTRLPHLSLSLRASIAYWESPQGFHLFVAPVFLDPARPNDGPLELGDTIDLWTVVMRPIERYRGETYNRHRHQHLIDLHRRDHTLVESFMRRWCQLEGVTLLSREPKPFDDDFMPDPEDVDAGGKDGAV